MPKESVEQQPLNESDDAPELERTTKAIKFSLKRYASEFIGTFLFVFLAVLEARLDGHSAVRSAFANGLIICVCITIFTPVSGGHFNPSVTWAVFLMRHIRWFDCLLYCVVQVAGGICAGLFVQVIVMHNTEHLVAGVSGATLPNGAIIEHIEWYQVFLCEMAITFILASAALMTLDWPHKRLLLCAIIMGNCVAVCIVASAEISGGSMNFARSFGPALVAWTFDLTEHAWAFMYCYAIAPIVGASLAAAMKYAILPHTRSTKPSQA